MQQGEHLSVVPLLSGAATAEGTPWVPTSFLTLDGVLRTWLLRGSLRQVAEQADGVGSAMAYNFLPCDRDQGFLLPPDVRDWLPSDHLAWFVLDVVDQLDLGPFLRGYRADGHGRVAYQPKMLLAVLLYAYCTGSAPPARSSGAATKTSPSESWPPTRPLIM
jgi:hypothetical protein